MVRTGYLGHGGALCAVDSTTSRPTDRASSTNPGNEVATLATSRTDDGLGGAQTRDAEGHGDPMIAVAVDLAAAERRTGGAALDAHAVRQSRCARRRARQDPRSWRRCRSLSLTRSSSRTGDHGLTPRAGGRDEQHRKLVDGERHQRGGHRNAHERRSAHPQIPHRLSAARARILDARCRPPMLRRMSSSPVRVGFSPTFRSNSPSPAAPRRPATMKNAAEEKSPGTVSSRLASRSGG